MMHRRRDADARGVGGGQGVAPIEAARRTSEAIKTKRRSWRSAEHAAERSQHDLGQDARRGGDPDPGRRPRALVDEGQQGEVVQPVSGLGGDQAAEQEAEVALTQRDEERAAGSACDHRVWWEGREPRNVGRSAAAQDGRSWL
jgi:hypothetical protein